MDLFKAIFYTLAILSIGVNAAFAEVRFAVPPPKKIDYEEFPESRFGGASTNAVEESIEDEGGYTPSENLNRSPASVSLPKSRIEKKKAFGLQEISIVATPSGFYPQNVIVYPGTPIRLYMTATQKGSHCLMQDDVKLFRQIRSQQLEEAQFTFKKPGVYRFYCPVTQFEGSFIVKEL